MTTETLVEFIDRKLCEHRPDRAENDDWMDAVVEAVIARAENMTPEDAAKELADAHAMGAFDDSEEDDYETLLANAAAFSLLAAEFRPDETFQDYVARKGEAT